MTYFHRCTSTIIGAKAFHGPVRDGKGWGRLAMVVKRSWLRASPFWGLARQLGVRSTTIRHTRLDVICTLLLFTRYMRVFFVLAAHASRYNLQGYRIKPHGQLVSVSLTHYCAYTPDLSTSWSRTTLQGALGPGIPNLQTSFPLRCLQRLSLPYIATRQCHWHDNRYTSGTSTPVLSY